MKIGILTVHSQINYGAVLQAFALQSVLENAGHKVTMLDRQLDADGTPLLGLIKQGSLVGTVKAIARGMLLLGDFTDLLRRIRTATFIKSHLNLSKDQFIGWNDLPGPLDVDLIVVGSDQVWNTKHHDPHAFLLDFEHKIPAITYAASFGTDSIDEKWLSLFRQKLPGFKRISVREKQAVRILENLGFSSTRVVDPTLLPNRNVWERFVRRSRDSRRLLVCYLMFPPSWREMRELVAFCRRNNCRAEVFSGVIALPISNGWRTFRDAAAKPVFSFFGCVRYRFSATPGEFVSSIANAEWVMTSAFHGLMFSCVFRKQVCLVRQFHKDNPPAFRRMEEFVADYMKGNVVVDEFKDALESLESEIVAYDDDKIEKARIESLKWLDSAVSST